MREKRRHDRETVVVGLSTLSKVEGYFEKVGGEC
jgi:hypothetical protein